MIQILVHLILLSFAFIVAGPVGAQQTIRPSANTPIRPSDTTTYADQATRDLITGARLRYEYQDSLIRDYNASVTSRIDVGIGRSRFARIPPIMAHETRARIWWSLPNDIRVEVIGQREASILNDTDMDISFDQPWFVPRSLGDSIRFLDDELPAVAALHPLAPGSDDAYRYEITDSVTLSLPNRTVEAVGVRVEPKILAPSLIAGDVWFDAQTLEIVRMTFVFVGEYNWSEPPDPTPEDSAASRRENLWATRVIKLEADLEYALVNRIYWMPYRQLVQLTVDIPWFVNAKIPVRFLSEFGEYEINTSALPQFEVPLDTVTDTLENGETRRRIPRSGRWQGGTSCRRNWRSSGKKNPEHAVERIEAARGQSDEKPYCEEEQGFSRAGPGEQGGRWEIHYVTKDSLEAFDDWEQPLSLNLSTEDERRIQETIASLGRLAEELPPDWVGRMPHHIAIERFTDLYRFNRVQGHSVGGGYLVRPGPAFTTLHGLARFGINDLRFTGTLTWRRDAPNGRLDVAAFRDVKDVDPWSNGSGFANSMNALITGHDDADYLLTTGASIRFRGNSTGLWRNGEVEIGMANERSIATVLSLATQGGRFRPNPTITEGTFVRALVSRSSAVGPIEFSQGADLLIGDNVQGNRLTAARLFADVRLPFYVAGRAVEVSARAGQALGDSVPQMRFRAGGINSVRGFDYGFRTGPQTWGLGIDIAVNRRESWTPLLFADIGDTSFSFSDPLIGVGGGVSLLRGSISLVASKGLKPQVPWRFDLTFQPLNLPIP